MAPVDPQFSAAFDRIFAPQISAVLPIPDLEVGQPLLEPIRSAVESLTRVTVWRTVDHVRVEFRFVNLELVDDAAGVRVLARTVKSRAAHLVAVFGPQHLVERAYFDPGGDPDKFAKPGPGVPTRDQPGEVPSYPVAARLSGPSRIAYTVTTQRIPYTRAGLLDAMRTLPLSVAPHAEGQARFVDFSQLADDVGALTAVTKRMTALGSSARRRLTQLAGDRAPEAPATAASLRRALAQNATSAVALNDVARMARLQRTASELELRFGAASAVSAVAEDVAAGIEIGPIFLPDTRPPVPREPTSVETAIELPWRLQLSPHAGGAFTHALDEVQHDGRVELWHTRLGTRAAGTASADQDAAEIARQVDVPSPSRTVRAVWARDFTADTAPARGPLAIPFETQLPFRASLSNRDRMQLVHLTSNHRIPKRGSFSPQAVPVENLMLTALGGWLASAVNFTGTLPPGLSIEEWQHRATMGRDHFVKVVYQGVLLPFGHRASLVKITERRVKGDSHATLYQRLFVVVKQPERRFLGRGVPEHDNAMPFRWVRILTAATPPLAEPKKIVPSANGQIFVPSIAVNDDPAQPQPASGGEPFRFRMIANDSDNRLVEFEGPMVFVEKTVFDGAVTASRSAVAAANNKTEPYELGGQRVAFAAPADPDDTTLAVASVRFDAIVDDSTGEKKTNFVLPKMRVASAVVPAMSAFTGQTAPQNLSYALAYRDHAFAAGANENAGGLFLQIADATGDPVSGTAPAGMDFSSQSDRSGGFVSPDIGITALARSFGPVGGDLATLASDPASFDVGSMFGALDSAKLFGILPLSELLPTSGSPLPKFVTQTVNTVVALQQAITQARGFALQFRTQLGTQSAALQQAADDLAAAADRLANAIVVFSGPTHPEQDFEKLITDIVAPAVTLRTAFSTPGAPLPLPRPVLEATDALLKRIADVADDIAAVAALVSQFYSGSLLPERVSATFEWETMLEQWAPGGISPAVFTPEGDKTLRLTSEVQAPLTASGEPTALVSCSLPPFRLLLLGGTQFIGIRVDVMEFSVRPGHKPDVNVKLNEQTGIEFLGPLAFVETLKRIIPFDGFSDPPYLDVQPSGLKAGFDLAIPDLAVGVFALTNIHLGAELSVPFIGESLEFRFFFATREDPFRLSVSLFAGGGFFAISISPKGVKMIEASFEFGAAVEMSFVVASGSLSVMAGIYFKLEIVGDKQSVQLTGFFRARGEVDVLGLISACIELYLELSYLEDASGNAKAVGKASISVEVSVCFLSFSVSVSCEKKFAGSKGDPTFEVCMGGYTDALGAARDPWAEYCGAFAPENV
ncbi:hypothetical protein [Conyzicola sp.]|uniref:hypothetical protein n=1 Tax=Conyzicola sp. TaxID=1969404 RepID=UPI003989FDD4